MEKLNASYSAKKEFPVNLVACGTHKDQLNQYRERLNDHSCRLFGCPEAAVVYLLQLDAGQRSDHGAYSSDLTIEN